MAFFSDFLLVKGPLVQAMTELCELKELFPARFLITCS